MESSFFQVNRVAWILVIVLGSLTGGFARERGPRVEVVCPSSPVAVRMDQRQVLAYELHVTNFDTVALTLKRLQVFASVESEQPISDLADDKLSAAMVRVGSGSAANEAKDVRIIEPGARAVVFLWVELAWNDKLPVSLRHRMFFSPGTDEGSADAILEDFRVPVSQGSAPVLSPPFHGGVWLAGDGPANNTGHRRSIFAIDGHLYSPERFAIDWIKVGANGDSHHEGTARNENWWGYGEPVLAVADGEITEVVDGIADNTPRKLPPVTLDSIAGNHIILQIAPNCYVTYAHLQNGSIKARIREKVHRGAVLALLGNSGNSTGAHLHLQVTDGNSVLESQGVPFVFSSFTYFGPGSDYEIDKHVSVPWKNSIPAGDAVVEFGAVK